jgi:hypothetical protein
MSKLLLCTVLALPLLGLANTTIYESRDDNGQTLFSDRSPVNERLVRQLESRTILAQRFEKSGEQLGELEKNNTDTTPQLAEQEKMMNYLQTQIHIAQNQLIVAQQLLENTKRQAPEYDNGNAPSAWTAYQKSLADYQQRIAGLESSVAQAQSNLRLANVKAQTYALEIK